MKTNDTATAANAFFALVDDEMAKTQCSLREAETRVRAQSPKLSASVLSATARETSPEWPLQKKSPEQEAAIVKLDALVTAEAGSSKCDFRTALERVRRREPALARVAFGP
jgi:hypothetical protein